MPVEVKFEGGPRSGKVQSYPRNPRTIGCVDEWKAAGMARGLYRQKAGESREANPVTMVWREV